MGIEDELSVGFKKYTGNVVMPDSLEQRLEQSFNSFYHRNSEKAANSTHHHVSFRAGRFAAVMLFGLLLLGGTVYGAQRLWSLTYSTGQLNVAKVSAGSDNAGTIGSAELNDIFQHVQDQLNLGESAYVYVPGTVDGDRVFKVNKVISYRNYRSWEFVTTKIIGDIAVPGEMPAGFHFVSGTSDSLLGILDTASEARFRSLLQTRVNQEQRYAWIKSDEEQNEASKTISPTVVYEGSSGEKIGISYSPLPQTALGGKSVLTWNVPDTATVEQCQVRGVIAAYVQVQDKDITSPDRYHASLQWIEKRSEGEMSIFYSVSTTSPKVGKEELLQVAKGLK
ncbi:hypothetical protein PSTEL_06840 [Paenibacillus stellifer]|uniref:DUF4367 domain-containing protein n=1 Tax=Paenibacillus stellifer TaxID=169760 RepID=A0A089LUI0_9BACL|nr:hypothetical protein [Paenibacillus stellifer]AIQ62863.1 hypothetical protein PSTEL_06840 [Paenibacillus stellifer]